MTEIEIVFLPSAKNFAGNFASHCLIRRENKFL